MSTLVNPLASLLPPPNKDAAKLASLVQKTSGVGHLKERIESGADTQDTSLHTLCIYGESDAGKTFCICGLLELGYHVFVLNTDVGGSGLRSVFQYIKRVGKPHLLDQLHRITLANYQTVSEFLKDPLKACPNFYDLPITILVWDGFSNFNINMVDEYVLEMDSNMKAPGELREAGLHAEQQDWGGIKRGTCRQLEKFLFWRNPKTGNGYSKILICLQTDEPTQYESRGSKKIGPLIQGAARKLLVAGVDLCVRALRTTNNGKKSYTYDCGSGDTYLTRARGYDLLPIEVADMAKFWTKITT